MNLYRLAPWRLQRQWIVNFLLSVIGLAMVAALYLDVTAQAAIAGRQIQSLVRETTAVQQECADLQTRFATLTSASAMRERALDLGYREMDVDEMEYLVVPGYVEPQADILSELPKPAMSAPTIAPEYNQSLLDWLDEQLQKLGGAR